ncbi:MAG: DUF5615 family PIN-like protein [Gluconacetobacter diazotrophicus]|nr:DUF5615 family PIN-like protein [Gluconacetobacter diazotrophicus]
MERLHVLIDECLSPALVREANENGFPADHVVQMGKGGLEDEQLAPIIFDGPISFTFVTNNRADFPRIHGSQDLHAGLVVIVPNVDRDGQLQLFREVVHFLAESSFDPTNHVVEVFEDQRIEIRSWRRLEDPRDAQAPTRATRYTSRRSQPAKITPLVSTTLP